MNGYRKIGVFGLLVVMIASGLAACRQNAAPTAAAEMTVDNLLTNTVGVETKETQITDTPQVILTETPTPTFTPTATFTPTWIPTLDQEKAFGYFESYYANNGGCDLPCWWGITPGESTVDDLVNLLSPLDRPRISPGDDFTIYHYAFDVPLIPPLDNYPDFPYMEPSFIIEDQTVTFIQLISLWVSEGFDYSLQGFLQEFGVPSEIWLTPIIDDWIYPYYYLELVYPESGVIISASDEFDVENKEVSLCLGEFKFGSFPVSLLLFSPQESFTVEEYYNAYGIIPLETDKVYHLEEVAFGYDERAFYDQFIESSGNDCIPLDEEIIVTIDW